MTPLEHRLHLAELERSARRAKTGAFARRLRAAWAAWRTVTAAWRLPSEA